MSRARNTADGIARAITDGIVLNADINASAGIDQSKFANLSVNPQSGSGASAYTFVLADEKLLTTATSASAKTFTIPPQSSVTWVSNSVIRVVNYGAGTLTIAGGAGVTVTNVATTIAQYESASVIRTAENAWTLVPFAGGGAGDADFSNAATGTYTDNGVDFKFLTLSITGTITISTAGVLDVLLVASGGGGGSNQGGGGGAGGLLNIASFAVSTGTFTATIGAGGAAATVGNSCNVFGLFCLGGGAGSTVNGVAGGAGGSGGGGSTDLAGGAGLAGQGFGGDAGGAGFSATTGGGGGAGAAATTQNGGTGFVSTITNVSVGRSGGGGGGNSQNQSNNGTASEGGGAGGLNAVGTPGTVNTGGGGGGNNISAGFTGGAGGSGIVIIRVRTN